jgi:hypothetical protein
VLASAAAAAGCCALLLLAAAAAAAAAAHQVILPAPHCLIPGHGSLGAHQPIVKLQQATTGNMCSRRTQAGRPAGRQAGRWAGKPHEHAAGGRRTAGKSSCNGTKQRHGLCVVVMLQLLSYGLTSNFSCCNAPVTLMLTTAAV